MPGRSLVLIEYKAVLFENAKGQLSSVLWKCPIKCTRWFWEKGLCRKSSLSSNSKFRQFSATLRSDNLELFWVESVPISFLPIAIGKNGFAGNRHFHGTYGNLGYSDTYVPFWRLKKNWTFGPFLTRIQSYLIFCPLYFILRFHRTLLICREFATFQRVRRSEFATKNSLMAGTFVTNRKAFHMEEESLTFWAFQHGLARKYRHFTPFNFCNCPKRAIILKKATVI